jgi:predicted nucleic acid-binding protein
VALPQNGARKQKHERRRFALFMKTLRTQVKGIMISVVILFIISIFAGYGMYTRSGGGKRTKDDYVVAEINGNKVMRSQLERGVADLAERSGMKNVTEADVVRLRRQFIDTLAIDQEFRKEIAARKINVSEAEIDAALKDIQNHFPTIEAYREYIQQRQINEKNLRKEIADNIAQQKILAMEVSGVTISGDEDVKFYDTLKELFFTRPETILVRAAHLKDRDKAQRFSEELLAGASWNDLGRAFSDDLASPVSEDSTVALAKGRVPEEIWTVVASLDDGAVTPPVVISEDIYVLERISRDEGGVIPFEDVSADVRELILGEKRKEAQRAYFASLRERATVRLLDAPLFADPAIETASPDMSPASPEVVPLSPEHTTSPDSNS